MVFGLFIENGLKRGLRNIPGDQRKILGAKRSILDPKIEETIVLI